MKNLRLVPIVMLTPVMLALSAVTLRDRKSVV